MGTITSRRQSSVEAISNLLFLEDDPPAFADLVVVLGSDWAPSMDPAIKLFQTGRTSRILVTGGAYAGVTRERTECAVFCDYALERGVPESVLLREEKATNTLENIRFSSPIVEQTGGWHSIRKVVMVAKSFATRRLWMTARKYWPPHLEYYFIPVIDERNIRSDNWWQDATAKKRVLEELRRIADYTLKGDIDDLSITGEVGDGRVC